MRTYTMTATVEVDEEILAERDDDTPPKDVGEWYGGDLAQALEEGIAELEHTPLVVAEGSA